MDEIEAFASPNLALCEGLSFAVDLGSSGTSSTFQARKETSGTCKMSSSLLYFQPQQKYSPSLRLQLLAVKFARYHK